MDDETSATEALGLLIQQFTPEITVVGTAASVVEAIPLVLNSQPDLVFLDIEMPGNDGFSFIKAFDQPAFEVVITTAHLKYAVQAIRLAAIDFLLKPVDPLELIQLANRKLKSTTPILHEQVRVLTPALQGDSPEMIALPTQTGFLFRPIKEIVRMEADNNYTRIFFLSEPPILVSKTLKHFEEILPEAQFLRIHRSHLIQITTVREFLRTKTPSVILADNTELPVAQDKKEALFQKLLALS